MRSVNTPQGLALVFGLLAAVDASPLETLKLLRRDPPTALPENASEDELKYQPVMDFDTDGCYNTPAIDMDGNIAEGLDHTWTTTHGDCRDEEDLDNNNVYSRSRCNNGWCAYM